MPPLGRALAPLAIIIAAAAACSEAPVGRSAVSVRYYYGQTSFFSADGRIPYGRTDSAVKREVLRGGALIRETVTRPGIAPGMSPMRTVSVFRRRGNTLDYDASDADGALSGTLTFREPELRSWSCALRLKSGGAVSCLGEATPAGLQIEKLISGPGSTMSSREDLPAVREDQYRARLDEMRPPAGAE